MQCVHLLDSSAQPGHYRDGHTISQSLVTRAVCGRFAAYRDEGVVVRKTLQALALARREASDCRAVEDWIDEACVVTCACAIRVVPRARQRVGNSVYRAAFGHSRCRSGFDARSVLGAGDRLKVEGDCTNTDTATTTVRRQDWRLRDGKPPFSMHMSRNGLPVGCSNSSARAAVSGVHAY